VNTPNYPAAIPHVISVAATDENDKMTQFSNYGSWVLCAAPGLNILSTWPQHLTPQPTDPPYEFESGTSQATPLVAGEAALLLAQNPGLSNGSVYSLILNNTDSYTPYTTGHTIASGGGRVNVFKALQAAGSAQLQPWWQNTTTGEIRLWA